MQGYQVRGISQAPANAFAGAPAQKKHGQVANALSFIAQITAPEAYEQGRQQKANRMIGNALAGGNYNQAAQTAYQYGNNAQGLELAQYGQQAQIEAQKRAQQQSIFEQLTPEQKIAAMYNPEAFGENYASNFGAQVVDQGQTFVRDAAGLGNVSVAPEAKVVGAGEVLAGQGGQILAQGPEAQPDLPTGMIMGPNGPQYVDGYLEGQERLRAAGRAQTTINTGDVAGGNRPIVGNPEPGTQLFYDEPGNTYRSQPIPGSDDDFTRQQGKIKLDLSYNAANLRHDGIIAALDTALGQTGPTTAGVAGVTALVPGMPAHDLAKTLDRIKAVIGFDRLQQMREESKTGGALGNVSEKEINFLQSVQGSLAQTQSVPQLLQTLQSIKTNLQSIHGFREQAYGLEASKFAETVDTGTGGLKAPEEMTREEILAELNAGGGQ